MTLSSNDKALVNRAYAIVGKFELGGGIGAAGGAGAAIRTVAGSVYTGISIDLCSGLGFCSEVNAMAQMLTHRETHIDMIVCTTKSRILSPCGRCREMMVQVDRRNFDCTVIVAENETTSLRQLLPNHWKY